MFECAHPACLCGASAGQERAPTLRRPPACRRRGLATNSSGVSRPEPSTSASASPSPFTSITYSVRNASARALGVMAPLWARPWRGVLACWRADVLTSGGVSRVSVRACLRTRNNPRARVCVCVCVVGEVCLSVRACVCVCRGQGAPNPLPPRKRGGGTLSLVISKMLCVRAGTSCGAKVGPNMWACDGFLHVGSSAGNPGGWAYFVVLAGKLPCILRRPSRLAAASPACSRKRVNFFGWVFFLISPAHLHVRPMGRTCR